MGVIGPLRSMLRRARRRPPLRTPALAIRLLACLAALACAGHAARAAKGEAPVDLELVLAVDISYSMDVEEQQIQRDGYAAAIVSRPVLDAIGQGLIGRIAVAYVEWAGADDQRAIVPWRLIDGPDSARAFAAELAAQPLKRSFRTSLSGALSHSVRLFENNGYDGLRRVIDISGDGPNNQGAPVEAARDEAVERGVVVNGLPLMLKRQSFGFADPTELDVYYRDCVVGGPGAFVLPVRSVEQFPEAVRTKLVMEIAGQAPDPAPDPTPERPVTRKASADAPQDICSDGERLWRERFGE